MRLHTRSVIGPLEAGDGIVNKYIVVLNVGFVNKYIVVLNVGFSIKVKFVRNENPLAPNDLLHASALNFSSRSSQGTYPLPRRALRSRALTIFLKYNNKQDLIIRIRGNEVPPSQ